MKVFNIIILVMFVCGFLAYLFGYSSLGSLLWSTPAGAAAGQVMHELMEKE